MREDEDFLDEAATRVDLREVPLVTEVMHLMDEYDEPLDVSTLADLMSPTGSLVGVDQAVEALRLAEIVRRTGEGYVLDPVTARAMRNLV